jgi:hypothetical protein
MHIRMKKDGTIKNMTAQSPNEFVWIFSTDGLLYQGHREADYQDYLMENYRSKTSSYQYLRSF